MRSMTPEERFDRIERQLEFLTTHQAQLYASLETLRDVSTRLTETAARHDGQIVQLHDVAASLVRIIEDLGRRTDERINLLVESQRRTDERLGDLTEKLNTLVNVVERYFSNGHK